MTLDDLYAALDADTADRTALLAIADAIEEQGGDGWAWRVIYASGREPLACEGTHAGRWLWRWGCGCDADVILTPGSRCVDHVTHTLCRFMLGRHLYEMDGGELYTSYIHISFPDSEGRVTLHDGRSAAFRNLANLIEKPDSKYVPKDIRARILALREASRAWDMAGVP